MLSSILEEVRDVVSKVVGESSNIPGDKKNLAVDVSSDAIIKGLMDNSKGLSSLFSGNGSSNAILESIQGVVVDSLMKKVGLNSGVAKQLVSSMLPMVMKALSGKGANGDAKFGLDTIIGALSNGGKADGNKSDVNPLLGAFSKLLK